MANSQNGWPVTAGPQQDRAPLIRDVTVPNGVLAGDVAVVFRWLAKEYDRRVERLVAGWCWGWFVKPIEGSSVVSNHASGTAVDFNAPANPMGTPTRRSMTADQVAECHALEREAGGVLRWGGDWGRPDPMHWEIVAPPGAVKRFADQLRGANRPIRRITMLSFDVTVPALREGDTDDDYPGSNHITRVQAIVGVKRDGAWGPLTTSAIAAMCKIPAADARTLDEPLYRKIYGLASP